MHQFETICNDAECPLLTKIKHAELIDKTLCSDVYFILAKMQLNIITYNLGFLGFGDRDELSIKLRIRQVPQKNRLDRGVEPEN